MLIKQFSNSFYFVLTRDRERAGAGGWKTGVECNFKQEFFSPMISFLFLSSLWLRQGNNYQNTFDLNENEDDNNSCLKFIA